jgi:hypothetical protein
MRSFLLRIETNLPTVGVGADAVFLRALSRHFLLSKGTRFVTVLVSSVGGESEKAAVLEYSRIQENTEEYRSYQMSKIVTLRLDDQDYEELKEAAAAESRPLSNLIAVEALTRIREKQFVDDAELAEIRENEKLVDRLRKGSKDAAERRGRFVE